MKRMNKLEREKLIKLIINYGSAKFKDGSIDIKYALNKYEESEKAFKELVDYISNLTDFTLLAA